MIRTGNLGRLAEAAASREGLNHCLAEEPPQEDEPVLDQLLQRDPDQTFGSLLEALLREGRAEHIAPQRLASDGIIGLPRLVAEPPERVFHVERQGAHEAAGKGTTFASSRCYASLRAH